MNERKTVNIGNKIIGDGRPVFIIAEIGINHNGDIKIAKQLIDVAKDCGCDAVKFQKRTVEVVYSSEELSKPRETPFGVLNADLKYGLELGSAQYDEINKYCKKKGIYWFASCWDEGSVDFIEQFDPVCYKIASPCLTNDQLLKHHKKLGKPIIMSTGMSDLSLIDHAVDVVGTDKLILLHCTSTYPTALGESNLRGIITLRDRFYVPIGYSGHETGLWTTYAAVALGACVVERHITLDRAMWGSDQAASIEPQGLAKLASEIRDLEEALGDGVIKIYDSEIPIMQKLRRVD